MNTYSPIYVASVDTRHYTFTAVGYSPEWARKALLKGWEIHCRTTGADPGHITADDISVTDGMEPGNGCCRDGMLI